MVEGDGRGTGLGREEMPSESRLDIVTQAVYPALVGGGAVGAHNLANALQARGWHVDVHAPSYLKTPDMTHDIPRAYEVHTYPFPRLPWDNIGTAGNPFVWRLAGGVRHSGSTVVHLRSHLFFTSLFGAFGARRAKKAIVLSVHGVKAERGWWINFLQEVWLHTVARLLFGLADRVVCLTERDLAAVRRYGAKPAKSVVLFNSFDETVFHPAPKGRPTADPPTALWVGRHVEEKGIRFLLDAWPQVLAKVPRARLVLVGDGPLRKAAEQQAADLGITKSVRFEPFLPQDQVAGAMRDATVFVLPSVREGFPLTLVEAMACGKPVVTSAGLDEIVQEAGTVVPVGDSAAIAAALSPFLENGSHARKVGDAARRRAVDRYGMSALADAYIAVYREAQARRRTS